MSKNTKKIGLLNGSRQKLQIQQEWVQMQDCRQPRKNTFRNTEDRYIAPKYYPLVDNTKQEIKQSNHSISFQQVFDPDVIKINGDTFQAVDKNKTQQPKPKKSKIPTMTASCFFCSTIQSVPGTASEFICGTCNKMNQCSPAYAIFICGTCQSKVLYAVATSFMIRCTKCSTINKVPSQNINNSYKNNPYITNKEEMQSIVDIRVDFEKYSQLEQFPQKKLYLDL